MDHKQQKNLAVWTEVGYDLFAREGLEGIQVERLARILQLNKSGFYHYFGDLEVFCSELMKLHKSKVHIFLQEVREIKNVDPEFLLLLVKHGTTVMFQVQLIRNKDNLSFYEVSGKVDQWMDIAIRPAWSEFIGVHMNADLSMRYFDIVRDMLYTRVSFENLNYRFLHALVSDARSVMMEIIKVNSLETGESSY